MKTKAILSVCLSVLFFVSTKAADLYVNNSGQSGTYTTIQTALNVASSGDRIFVSPYGVYSEDLTISKSVLITSTIANLNIVVNGNITFWPFANDVIELVGINAQGASLTSNTISATVNTKAKIILTNCQYSSDVSLNHDAIEVYVLKSKISGNLRLKYGKVVGNNIGGSLRISDGPNTLVGDTTLIVANDLTGYIEYGNNDNYYRISNNISSRIVINIPVYNTNIDCFITNNYTRSINQYNVGLSSSGITFAYRLASDNYSNVQVIGNIHHGYNTDGNPSGEDAYLVYYSVTASSSLTSLSSNITPLVFYNILLRQENNGSYNINGGLYYSPSSHSTRSNYNKNIYISYSLGSWNLFNSSNTAVSSTSKLSLALGAADFNNLSFIKDSNTPTTDYYDIDLTRGNIGPWGGPYSAENYWNSGVGNTRIIDLNIPSEIWPGQTVNLKAEAVHTN